MTITSQNQVGSPNGSDPRFPPRTAEGVHGQQSVFSLDLTAKADGKNKLGELTSVYVSALDGVRIALDVTRPIGDTADTKRDTVLVMTCYGRGKKDDPVKLHN